MSQNLQLSHTAHKLLVTGKSGHGKSTYWLRSLLGTKARVKFIFDHKGEVCARLGCKPCFGPRDLAAAVPTGWVIYQPAKMFPGRPDKGFLFFCELAYDLSQSIPGTKLFACDELQQWIDTNSIPIEFGQVIYDGRIRGLDASLISSEPHAIHNRVRGQITEVAAFRTEEENALAWLSKRGFDVERVKLLPPGHFICRNDQGLESCGAVF